MTILFTLDNIKEQLGFARWQEITRSDIVYSALLLRVCNHGNLVSSQILAQGEQCDPMTRTYSVCEASAALSLTAPTAARR